MAENVDFRAGSKEAVQYGNKEIMSGSLGNGYTWSPTKAFFIFEQSPKRNFYVTCVKLFPWSVANMWRLLNFKIYEMIAIFFVFD